MTAISVIDDHSELSNVGTTSHTAIDVHILSSSFVVASGSVNVPVQGRILVAGSGVVITDNGPGSTLVVSAAPVLTQSISWNEIPLGDVDGVNTVFTFQNSSYPQSSMMLFLNGQKLRQGLDSDYTLSGSTVTFVPSLIPRSGSNIDATYPYV